MIAGGLIFTIGAALLYTLSVNTNRATWVGYQLLVGSGSGMITQQCLLAIQAVLPSADIPIGSSLIIFFQTLGGAIFLSISQAIFNAKLSTGLAEVMSAENDTVVLSSLLNSGAADLPATVPAKALPAVLEVYNRSVTIPFVISATMSGVAVLGSLGMEWISVKGKNMMAGPPVDTDPHDKPEERVSE